MGRTLLGPIFGESPAEKKNLLGPIYGGNVSRKRQKVDESGWGTKKEGHLELSDLEVVIRETYSAVTGLADRLSELASNQRKMIEYMQRLSEAVSTFVAQAAHIKMEEQKLYNQASSSIKNIQFTEELNGDPKPSQPAPFGKRYTVPMIAKLCENPKKIPAEEHSDIVWAIREILTKAGKGNFATRLTTDIFKSPCHLDNLMILLWGCES